MNINYFAFPGVKIAQCYWEPGVVLKRVAEWYQLNPGEIIRKSRERPLVHARYVAIYIIRNKSIMSLKEIGRFFNHRDHTTVIHAMNTVQDRMYTYPAFRHEVSDIIDFIALNGKRPAAVKNVIGEEGVLVVEPPVPDHALVRPPAQYSNSGFIQTTQKY